MAAHAWDTGKKVSTALGTALFLWRLVCALHRTRLAAARVGQRAFFCAHDATRSAHARRGAAIGTWPAARSFSVGLSGGRVAAHRQHREDPRGQPRVALPDDAARRVVGPRGRTLDVARPGAV